ncbi:uncharacterized protein B0H18DRAFT_883771, partial [Fomitopsis serialis]|uniref:uncharacterized protein n=1 Tax=Fomitopsis serialis TaxID=139415 RepID=UPI002008A220
MIRSFIWGNTRTPPVALDTLYRPVKQGGLGLLDIRSRNEAIELVWVKRYLTLSDARPTWAFAMDVLISKCATRDASAIRPEAQINTFLQSWSPATHSRSPLPPYAQRMLLVAKKHNVSFAAIKLDRRTKEMLPMWYHLGATKRLRTLNNTPRSDCLRRVHHATQVHDLIMITGRACFMQLRETQNDHTPDTCGCTPCTEDKLAGCKNPLRCCRAAHEVLKQIRPKWDPVQRSPTDGLSLTRRRKDKNGQALEDSEEVTFDPSLTCRGPLDEAFRAFVDPMVHDQPPAIRRRQGRIVEDEATTVY